MLPITGWALVYADGSRYSNTSGQWRSAPDEVQVLVLYHSGGYRTLTYGEDVYSLLGQKATKLGAWMDTTDYYALVDKVIKEG